MLNKIRIQRESNNLIDEMVNKVLFLIPNDAYIDYNIEKAQFITNGVISKEDIYFDSKSFDLEEEEKIEEFISQLKKDIVSEHTISIDVKVDGINVAELSMYELGRFRDKLYLTENNLWSKEIKTSLANL